MSFFFFLFPTTSALNSRHFTDTRTMFSGTVGELLIMFTV